MVAYLSVFVGFSAIANSLPISSGQSESQAGAPWGLARLSHKEWSFNNNGNTFYSNPNNSYFYHEASNPVTVYMLDTGVDVSHPEFGGRAQWGYNFASSTNVDDNGHGTHLAGIAIGKDHGVARNANLVAVKILDWQREGSVKNFSKAVDWVINDHKTRGGKAVINYSAVGSPSQYRAAAVQRATSNGIIVVNAAGNDNADSCSYGPTNLGPDYNGLLTVGALNWTNAPATFSNIGGCIDVWAPGVDIQSSLPNNEYGYMDGTSHAAAFVSGLVAYLWGENPSLSLDEMMVVVRTANPNALIQTPINTTSAIAYNYYS